MNNVIAFLRLITRSHKGYYCGYVGVKDDSMLPDSIQANIAMTNSFDKALDDYISIHGGITFDGYFKENTSILPLTDIPIDWYKYHAYGFDLNHSRDNVEGISMNFDYAKEQALSMKEQMERLIEQLSPSTGD